MDPALALRRFSGGAEIRRAALLGFCAERLALDPERLGLDHDELGAPLLLIDGAPGRWRISSASRENIALFGLSAQKIGVDVELAAAMDVPWNILHRREKAALAALPEAARAAAFLRLWTAREAYVKALGLGLRREPGELLVEPSGAGFRLFDGAREAALAGARLWGEKIDGREAICACVTLLGPAPGPAPARSPRTRLAR